MSRFRSIRLKIVAPLALFILVVAIFNSIYFPSKEADRIDAIFQQRLEISLATLVLGTSISISSGNLEGAEATVDLLKEDEHLTFLMVLDDEGSELIRHGTLDTKYFDENAFRELPVAEFQEIGPYLVLKDKIQFGDEYLGSAIIGLNTAEREREIRSSVILTVLLSLAVAIVGIGFISYVTKRVILISLAKSVHVAEQVATGDLSVDIETSGNDEVGQLLTAFRTMTEGLRSLRPDPALRHTDHLFGNANSSLGETIGSDGK